LPVIFGRHILMTGNASSDLEVLERTRAGDPAALQIILDRYWASVARYAMTLLGDSDEAEDAAQECFVRLWERRESWALEGSLRGLLFRIVRNLAFDKRRRNRARERATRAAPAHPPPHTPEQHTETTELRLILERAIGALPQRRREVFVLVRCDGLSHREVAQLLGLSPQTVANHLSLALSDLREALASTAQGEAPWTS